MTDAIDRPGAVREEDALDVGALDAWLREAGAAGAGTPSLRQFAEGASNLTYLLSYDDRDVVLRCPPRGTKAKSAHDMGREVRVLRALAGRYPVPAVYAHDVDGDVVGRELYAMERVRGVILRKDPPEGLVVDGAALSETFVQHLAGLHALDPVEVGLDGLGRGPGYTRRQVDGWSRRYRAARTPDAASFEAVMGWLDDHCPEDAGAVLVHNDFRFDNLVLDPDDLRVVGVLDWEMATVGDPLADLGNSLAYWIEPGDDPVAQMTRRQPTTLPGMLTRAELVERYAAVSGRPVDDIRFYLVQGVFRLAVIVQQIHYRYHHGQTTNPRFANFGALAAYLETRCQAFLEGDLQ